MSAFSNNDTKLPDIGNNKIGQGGIADI